MNDYGFGGYLYADSWSDSPPHAAELQLERVISPTAISEEAESPKEKPRPRCGK